MLRSFLIFSLKFLLLRLVASTPSPHSPHVCKSIEIRSTKDFELMRNCRIIVGHVSILNIEDALPLSFSSPPVEEITDYLLVHRAHGLQSLQHIFPKLVLIRGRDLLFGKYSLVVYENRYLLDLGLIALLRIQKGDIRIEANPVLCFVHTINWIYLMGNSTQQHFALNNNQPQNYCPFCISTENLIDDDVSEAVNQRCWNFDAYQREAIITSCPRACGTAGCNVYGTCCNRNCLSGCDANDCRLCANLQLGQKCVDRCNFPLYQLNKRECVAESVCREYELVPHAAVCMERCPDHYEQLMDARGQIFCKPICSGLFVVHTTRDLDGLVDCDSIHGSLIIDLTDVKSRIVIDLDNALVNIKEITGYLKVVHSPQLMSLNFLRNLDTIRGDELIDNKYALYVVNNHHLEQLWAPKQNVAIAKGTVYFHINPHLCYDKIMKLQGSLKNGQNITVTEVSHNSNGERVICGSNIRVLEATVEDKNSTAVRIRVQPMTADDKLVLIGYLHHYMEAPVKNVTKYDGRHGCGHDNWNMDISPSQNVRHIIGNLKPFTQYAFFVKTLTMTDYHMQIDAYSVIQYFKTLPSKPGPVAKIYYHTLSANKISVHWWPPHNLNGRIQNYIIFYEEVEVPVQKSNKNYPVPTKTNLLDTCECHKLLSDNSGPPPKDENYYNKEQITYDEALVNFIYTPRYAPQKKKTNNSTNQLESNETSTVLNSIESNTTLSSILPSTVTPCSCSTTPSPFSSTTTTPILSTTTTTPTPITTTTTTTTTPIKTTAIALFNKSDTILTTTTPTTTITASIQNDTITKKYSDKYLQAQLNYNLYRQEMEEKALREQDTGLKGFIVLQPLKVCAYANVSVQYQLENSCTKIEQYEGTVVDGHLHSYTLENLLPNVTYRISIRACVADLMNGCGSETTTLAKTVSKDMETFLRSLGVL